MIVLDDQLSAPYLKREIEKWYAGSVIVLGSLRLHGIIKDDGVAALLHSLRQPTFVTINDDDFWDIIEANPKYCVVCFNLPRERAREIPSSLRVILNLPEFASKRQRLGKVILVGGGKVRYYE